MSDQWKRQCQLVIGKDGEGIKIEGLRIKFEIVKTIEATPNRAVISVYNMNHSSESKIHNEYDEVVLNAGYADNHQMIFRGNIQYVFQHRDRADTIIEIEAADGDKDYRQAVMNETLAAGTSHSQIVDRAVASFQAGTIKGHVQAGEKKRIRGKVLSGSTRDILNDLSRESGANWSIQNGQLDFVSTEDVLPGEAVVIRADTGMLEAPEANDKGIVVKTLLNPSIRINGAIKLDNKDIRAKRQEQNDLATRREKSETNAPLGRENEQVVGLDPDGIYKVIKLTHEGDTRSNEWYTRIECIGLNQPIPESR